MVQAKELKIGNFVDRNDLPKEENVFFKIMSISDHRIHKVTTHEIDFNKNSVYSSECELDNLEPIPLSPALLVKHCGFGWYDNDWYEIKGMIHLSVELKSGYIYLGKGEYLFKSNIIYLHQLQNLFYALCQTELPITSLK